MESTYNACEQELIDQGYDPEHATQICLNQETQERSDEEGRGYSWSDEE